MPLFSITKKLLDARNSEIHERHATTHRDERSIRQVEISITVGISSKHGSCAPHRAYLTVKRHGTLPRPLPVPVLAEEPESRTVPPSEKLDVSVALSRRTIMCRKHISSSIIASDEDEVELRLPLGDVEVGLES